MTFSPVDNELLLSEIDMMEVYGGTGDGEDTNVYCDNANDEFWGDFDKSKAMLINRLEEVLPNKSEFEN